MNPIKKDENWADMSGGQRVGVVIAGTVLLLVAAWVVAVLCGLAVKVLAAVWS